MAEKQPTGSTAAGLTPAFDVAVDQGTSVLIINELKAHGIPRVFGWAPDPYVVVRSGAGGPSGPLESRGLHLKGTTEPDWGRAAHQFGPHPIIDAPGQGHDSIFIQVWTMRLIGAPIQLGSTGPYPVGDFFASAPPPPEAGAITAAPAPGHLKLKPSAASPRSVVALPLHDAHGSLAGSVSFTVSAYGWRGATAPTAASVAATALPPASTPALAAPRAAFHTASADSPTDLQGAALADAADFRGGAPNCLVLLVERAWLPARATNAFVEVKVGEMSVTTNVRSPDGTTAAAPGSGGASAAAAAAGGSSSSSGGGTSISFPREGWAFPVSLAGTEVLFTVRRSGFLGLAKTKLAVLRSQLFPAEAAAVPAGGAAATATAAAAEASPVLHFVGSGQRALEEQTLSVPGSAELAVRWRWVYVPQYDPEALARQGLRVPAAPLRVTADGGIVGASADESALDSLPDGSTGEVMAKAETAAPTGDAGSAAAAGDGIRREVAAGMDEPTAATSVREMRAGDWQVHVHIIEARQLSAEQWNGTSSPVVYVEVGGAPKQNTRVHPNTTTCVFDEHMVFQVPGLTKPEAEALTATISVCNHNTVLRASTIGCFTFDAATIYGQPDGGYYERWIGLVNPQSASSRGVRGFLKVSLYVVGPNDKPPPRHGVVSRLENAAGQAEAAAARTAAEATSAGGNGSVAAAAGGAIASVGGGATVLFKRLRKAVLAKTDDGIERDLLEEASADELLLLPPFAKRTLRWLVIGVFRARGLPAMDSSPPGIDAYVECSFGGCTPIRTQFVTRRGTGKLDVEWNEELWVPYQEPFLFSGLELHLHDMNWVAANDLFMTLALDMAAVKRPGGLPLAWHTHYGPPDKTRFLDNPILSARHDGKAVNRMRRVPDLASHACGSLLLSVRTVDESAADKSKLEVAHKKPRLPDPRAPPPPTRSFLLCVSVQAGVGEPVTTHTLQAESTLTWRQQLELAVELPVTPDDSIDPARPSPTPLYTSVQRDGHRCRRREGCVG